MKSGECKRSLRAARVVTALVAAIPTMGPSARCSPFASTTETADWLLRALGLRRTPILRWGPRGMQQLSEARAGRFELLGFAGNSAPDHDLHAMPKLLARAVTW